MSPHSHTGHRRWLRFIELPAFARRRQKLRINDDDLRALQIIILVDPAAAPVIQGTGGVRKMRFAPPSLTRGKSGALRVLYAYFPMHGAVALFTAYAKNEQANVAAADRKLFQKLMAVIEKSAVGSRPVQE